MTTETERIAIILQLENDQFERKAKNAARAVERIEARFDPLAKAASKYEREQAAVNRALQAGKIDAARHKRVLDELEAEYKQASAAAENLSAVTRRGYGSMRSFQGIAQQAGYQIGDFAVQVQGGTSAVVAFSQQGSQLLGVFGAYGAVAGAALAIGAPLAASFFKIGEGAEDAEKAIEAFEEAAGQLSNLRRMATAPIEELRQEFGDFAESVQAASQIVAQAALSQAMRSFDAGAAGLKDALIETRRLLGDYQSALDAYEFGVRSLGERTLSNSASFEQLARSAVEAKKELDEAARAIGLTAEQAQTLDQLLVSLAGASGMAEIAQRSNEALEAIRHMFGASTDLPEPIEAMIGELQSMLEAAARGATAIEGIGDAAVGAAVKVSRLANLLGQVARDNAVVLDPRDPKYDPILAKMAQIEQEYRNPKKDPPSRGGSGSRRQQTEDEREAARVIQSLMTATEKYNLELARLQELQEGGHLSADQFARAQENLRDALEDAKLKEANKHFKDIADSMSQAIIHGEDLADVLKSIALQLGQRSLSGLLSTGLSSLFGSVGSGDLFGGNSWGRTSGVARAGAGDRLLAARASAPALPSGGGEVAVRLIVPEGVTAEETQQIAGNIAVRVVTESNRGRDRSFPARVRSATNDPRALG